jgi:hypothetical protein
MPPAPSQPPERLPAIGQGCLHREFLNHAEIVQITGKSYRLHPECGKGKESAADSKPAIALSGGEEEK